MILLVLLLSCSNTEGIRQQIHDFGYTDIRVQSCGPKEVQFTAADPHARKRVAGVARISAKGKVEGVTVRYGADGKP